MLYTRPPGYRSEKTAACRIDDAYACDVHNDSHPAAQKHHTCRECRRTIKAGESYELVRVLWDGSWNTIKTCTHCQAAREFLGKYCSGWVYGEVLDELVEHYDELSATRFSQLGRVCVAMKNQWASGSGLIAAPVWTFPRGLIYMTPPSWRRPLRRHESR